MVRTSPTHRHRQRGNDHDHRRSSDDNDATASHDAPDVDCAGGSGNGPAYADGPVEVIGADIYGLDSNNDGVACE